MPDARITIRREILGVKEGDPGGAANKGVQTKAAGYLWERIGGEGERQPRVLTDWRTCWHVP